MTTRREGKVRRPTGSRGRWTSFVADSGDPTERRRGLHEESNPQHRLRVEHDARTLLIHLSNEDGRGWTTVAVDRGTRQWEVAQCRRQSDAARRAYDGLYQS